MNAGRWLIVGIFAVAVAAGAASWIHRLRQTDDVLAFWGAEVVDRIAHGSAIAIERQANGSEVQNDVTKRRGMPNVRHTLLRDFTYNWTLPPGNADPPCGFALAFNTAGQVSRLDFSSTFDQVWLNGGSQRRFLQPQAAKYFEVFFAEQFPRESDEIRRMGESE